MRVPLTIDGHDVVAVVGADDITVRELTGPASGIATVSVAARTIPLDQPVATAAIRPGDDLRVMERRAGPSEPAGWAVHVIAGVDAGRAISFPAPLDGGERLQLLVGCDANAHVRLASPAVSKHHCTITVDGGTISVTDAGSTNGTVVRGNRIGSTPIVVEADEPIRCRAPAVSRPGSGPRAAPRLRPPRGRRRWSMYEAVSARSKEISPVGLILSGDREEEALLGSVKASQQPPGRGTLVSRRQPPTLVQVACAEPVDSPEPVHEPALATA